MTNIRLLPKDEYHRLKPIWPFDNKHPFPDGDFSRVVVAEKDGAIVGFWFAVQTVHVEPIWISEEVRDGGLIATRMLRGLIDELHKDDIFNVYVFSDKDNVSDYLGRLGFAPLPDTTVFIGEV